MPGPDKAPMPKILHVVLSMAVGGAEKLVFDMVRHPAFERKPVVCCLDAVGDLGALLLREGYTVHLKNRRSGVDLAVIPWLRDIMRAERIDVVHAHQYTPLFYATPAAYLAGRIRVIYTEHGRFYPERTSWKRILFNPILALGVDRLVSISAATAKAMARYDRLPSRRIEVVHNGVDLSRMNPPLDTAAKRRELGLSDACRVVGTAARLDEVKNIPMMLRGFKRLLESVPEAVLVIAGEGPQGDDLRRLAADLSIADRVRFIGLRFDMPEIYRLFEVFLLTSYSEGISVTLLEAMASYVPVVATAVGGNCEVVVDRVCGYLVPVGDAEALARRASELLQDRSLAGRIGHSGARRVHQEFSFDGMVDAYRRMYRRQAM